MKKYALIAGFCFLGACVSNNKDADKKYHDSSSKKDSNSVDYNHEVPGGGASAQETAGKELFESNCAACHSVEEKLIGPALMGVNERHSREWLLKFIRNSQQMINSGDPMAVKLYNENNKMVMTPFEHLSDTDIDNILAYIKTYKASNPEVVAD